jgi:4'-phosphopantetheinyl transferase
MNKLWQPRPTNLNLGPDDVHVWMAWLDEPVERISHLYSTLAEDERDRASRFHFQTDRDRYVMSRGVLRELLGRYLEKDPTQINLAYGPNGKPEIAGYGVDHSTQFNLAHSENLVLFAFTLGRPIGIDVEKIRPLKDIDGIASRYFSTQEYLTWRAFAPTNRFVGFFRLWTCKEAFIKAIGAGLSYPLDQFDIALSPGKEARLLNIAGDEREAKRWTVRELRPAKDFAAAIVARDKWGLSRWRID